MLQIGPVIKFPGFEDIGRFLADSLDAVIGRFTDSPTATLQKEMQHQLGPIEQMPRLPRLADWVNTWHVGLDRGQTLFFDGASFVVDENRGHPRQVRDSDLRHLNELGISSRAIVQQVRKAIMRMNSLG